MTAGGEETNLSEASLYIFVSFSLGEKALLNLAREAKQFDAILVLRGFKEGSYRKTAQALQEIITKTGQGVFNLLGLLSHEFKRTIIMVTHNPELAEATDRAIYIRDGSIENEVVRLER